MIMMCPDRARLSEAFETYKLAVKKLHLYIHDDTPMTFVHMRDFWNGKTRAPYAWDAPGNEDIMPWITFVGFDINWQGETRIRKSTYHKEIQKQYEKYREVRSKFADKRHLPLRHNSFIQSSVWRIRSQSSAPPHPFLFLTVDHPPPLFFFEKVPELQFMN